MISQILDELNVENGSNYKMGVLRKHKDNKLLQRVLKMAYDRVAFTYGITMKNVTYCPEGIYSTGYGVDLDYALDILEQKFCTRILTGNEAITQLSLLLEHLTRSDAKIIEKVLGRDLKINIGKTQINKVFKDLITKPVYCRCDIYGVSTAKNIKFPAILQKKSDGTYREFCVQDGHVECQSRSGEKSEFPLLNLEFKNFPNGYYTGELTVKGTSNRFDGNGLINSDEPPHDAIVVELWDYITMEEYQKAGLKDKKNPCTIPYSERWNRLKQIVVDNEMVSVIAAVEVNNLKEALEQTSKWMQEGFEGAILKDYSMVFKDGTSKYQQKIKLVIELEVRCVGFTAGTIGTKREQFFGAIEFETDDGQIKGQCSGFTDDQLAKYNGKRDQLIGKIFTVQCNDIVKGRNNDYHALTHPRFIEFRDDRDTTDDLERALKQRDSAMALS